MLSSSVTDKVRRFTSSFLDRVNISKDAVKGRFVNILHGFAARITPEKAKAIEKLPAVDYVVQNHYFKAINLKPTSAISKDYNMAASQSQITPWNVSAVYGPLDGTGKVIWMLDTGVEKYGFDEYHPDLNVFRASNFVNGESTGDVVGHGTFIAGIVAAKDNNMGVVGVASGATVKSLKVIDANGNYTTYDVCFALDFLAFQVNPSQNMIILMSIQSQDEGTIVDQCTRDMADLGYRIVVPAGDYAEHADNSSPGRVDHPNIYTVSAVDINGYFATDFSCGPPSYHLGSNYGNPPINYAGPGEDVISLALGGGTTNGCSTSYAAAHVAGLLLASPQDLAISYSLGDPDGNPDPILVHDVTPPPPTVEITGPEYMNEGQTATFTANVTGGTPPYGYAWSIKTGPLDPTWEVIRNATSSTYNHTAGSTSTEILKISVYDHSSGQTAHDQHKITITQFN